jgi:hypothetical protein
MGDGAGYGSRDDAYVLPVTVVKLSAKPLKTRQIASKARIAEVVLNARL